jgi:hypothetical protein
MLQHNKSLILRDVMPLGIGLKKNPTFRDNCVPFPSPGRKRRLDVTRQWRVFSVAQAFTPVERTPRHPPFFPSGPLQGAARAQGTSFGPHSTGVSTGAAEKCAFTNSGFLTYIGHAKMIA